ncbi:MAG: DUF2786 domain-containing protein [Spirochaetaceae bacterium]|jgi:hypothetical protein|nr:DUF2786 domain-containing protein [Spirochaetaceae bacterium]
MDNLEKIKSKIKKLLALSKSPNANEAAAALEMARDMMEKYGVGAESAGQFDVSAEEFKGNGGERPPKYEMVLVTQIAKAFGCRNAYGVVEIRDTYHCGHTLIGVEHRAKIAAFMAEVLLRKLKAARTKYVQSLTRVKIRANKIRRADEFCSGWVTAVIGKLREFANNPEEETAVEKAVRDAGWGGKTKFLDRKPPERNGWDDYFKGKRAAAGIEPQHGVEGEESGARLLRGAV